MEAQGADVALDQTTTQLRGGVLRLGIGAAIPVIVGWEGTLAASPVPELREVAANLSTLRGHLASESFDPSEVSGLLSTLASQVRRVMATPYGLALALPLTQISLFLNSAAFVLAQQAGMQGGTSSGMGADAPGAPSTVRELEQTQAVDAPPDAVFAWLSDVSNLPKYLPPVIDASIQGPSSPGAPGQRVRTTLEYPGGEGTFEAEGYLAVYGNERRMEWGAEAGRDYSGWLEVAEDAARGSQVTVHLNFGERSVEAEQDSPEGRDPLQEGVTATLESIRRQIEEGSGKVEPPQPPPGAEPSTADNPAVVKDNPPNE